MYFRLERTALFLGKDSPHYREGQPPYWPQARDVVDLWVDQLAHANEVWHAAPREGHPSEEFPEICRAARQILTGYAGCRRIQVNLLRLPDQLLLDGVGAMIRTVGPELGRCALRCPDAPRARKAPDDPRQARELWEEFDDLELLAWALRGPAGLPQEGERLRKALELRAEWLRDHTRGFDAAACWILTTADALDLRLENPDADPDLGLTMGKYLHAQDVLGQECR